MITTSKAASQDVFDLIDDDFFIMEDIEQDLFVVFECLDETDEITIEENGLIVRIPHSEMLSTDDTNALITLYYLKGLEEFDEGLFLLVSNRLQQAA